MNPRSYGVLYALAAFAAWGLLPAYWKQVQDVPPIEILCHRVVWSCLFLCLIISLQGRWAEVREVAGTTAHTKKLFLSGTLIAFNWFIYIWAVNSNHVVETSLGYYINPMVNVLIGFLLLGERFRRLQVLAIALALGGVAYSLLAYGRPPVFALTLALSFAFYGYARKKIKVLPIPGLLIETCVLLIPALGYLSWRLVSGQSLFLQRIDLTLWLIGSGMATSLPLLWFASATRRLQLSTIGILQYLAPSIAFVLGVYVYGEPFGVHSLVTFSLIWLGVIVYSLELLRHVGSDRKKSYGEVESKN